MLYHWTSTAADALKAGPQPVMHFPQTEDSEAYESLPINAYAAHVDMIQKDIWRATEAALESEGVRLEQELAGVSL